MRKIGQKLRGRYRER